MAATDKTYTSLEPSFAQSLGATNPTFATGGAVELFASTSFLYSLGIMLSVVAAGVMYARAGLWRMEASERGVRRSNEEIKRTTLGLLGVLSLFVVIYTFNPDLLTGEVGLRNLRAGGMVSGGGGDFGGGGATGDTGGGSETSASCADPKTVISSLTTQNGICGGARCTALSGCNFQQYLPIIESKAREAGVETSIVIAIMCRESKARSDAKNQNPNGTFDCGLMQVNQPGACDATSLDPTTNITRGIQKIKQAMSIAGQVYQNIPPLLGVFATYNCCANGTVPNAASADCTQAAGFPYSIPKWACPINPGDGRFNMCTVKSYACDINACVDQLNSM